MYAEDGRRGPGRDYSIARARVLAIFKAEPELTNRQIAQRLGVSKAFVDTTLQGMRKGKRK